MNQQAREKLFSELEEHLNKGCVDENCEIGNGFLEFSPGFINHLIDIIEDTYESSES